MTNLIRVHNEGVNVARADAFPALLLVIPCHFLLPPPQCCGVGQSPSGKATTPRPGKKGEKQGCMAQKGCNTEREADDAYDAVSANVMI